MSGNDILHEPGNAENLKKLKNKRCQVNIFQTTYDVVKLESVLTAYDYEVRMFHSCQLDPERKPTIDAKLQDKPCIYFIRNILHVNMLEKKGGKLFITLAR